VEGRAQTGHGRNASQYVYSGAECECNCKANHVQQLVGTVLSLWDAAELDGAGQDGEVTPTFINLADASIKMVTMDMLGSGTLLIVSSSKHCP
jgi:hypothetical protein